MGPDTPTPTADPDGASTPIDRLLTSALLVAPLVYLAADSTYAARGWTDPTAAVLHVIGAIAYGFVILRVASWLPRASRLGAAVVLVGLIGMAGNVAYGFDTIHQSLGDTPLVDQPGAANLIKPLGLFFPLSLALVAAALGRRGHRWQGAVLLVAAVAWPVGHIANIATVAVLVNVALVVALGSLVWTREQDTGLDESGGASRRAGSSGDARAPRAAAPRG
jgi:hypothetical protein